MSQNTNSDVKVVVLPESRENAYDMGFREFNGMDLDNPEELDLGPFYDSARYCNNILPRLRCMSGYQDNGHGTWTSESQVVTVEYPENRPMDGNLTESVYMLEDLLESWTNGVYDAVDNEEYGHSLE